MGLTGKMGRANEERPAVLAPSPKRGDGRASGWTGPTYYGRPQLKPAPFNNWVVGGYIFLAGLSGSSSLLGHIAELVGGPESERLARRARKYALLAPTIGSALLIEDLHTPKRFYNMLRVAKLRSPMSIGTWILMTFSAGAFPAAVLHFLADHLKAFRWLRRPAHFVQAPATLAGAGLSVYTAALMSATSTPSWASAPQALSVRYGASSVASAASALMLGERSPKLRRTLATLTCGALVVEAAASAAQAAAHRAKGVEEASGGGWGRAETIFALGLGVLAPVALLGASLVAPRARRRVLHNAAALATIGGSAMLRIATLGVGDDSATRPEISLRFAQPANLP